MDMSNPTTPEVLNGSDILVRCLQAEGVKYMWGYPGGAVLYIYDALYKQDSIQHVLVRHEQGASHMADGYARAAGGVGVAGELADGELQTTGRARRGGGVGGREHVGHVHRP